MNLGFLLLSFLGPLFFYLKTLLPTVGFWDIGEAQTIPYTLDIAHPTGFPTYILLGKIFIHVFPLGSIAWRMNFFSSFLVSLGCVFLAAILYKLTKDYFLSLFGVFLFGLNKFVWEIAIRADVHSLHLFFTSLLLFLLIKILIDKKVEFVPLIAFVLGLSIGNHLLSIFFMPLFFLVIFFVWELRKGRFRGLILFSFSLFFCGISVYLLLPLIAAVKPPLTIDYNVASWKGFVRLVVGSDFQPMMRGWTKGNFFDSIIYYFEILKTSFSFWGLIFVLIGIIIATKKWVKLNVLLILFFLLTVGFGLRYSNAALERYFISSLLLGTLWVVVGVKWLKSFFKKFFGNFSELIVIFLFLLLFIEVETAYKKVDQSKNFTALNFAKETFANVANDGVIISWWSYSTPLWYWQMVEGERKDIKIYNLSKDQWEKKIKDEIDKRPIFLIEEIDLKNPEFELRKVGNLYQAVKVER